MILYFFILQYKCFIETCNLQFWDSVERNDHCIQIHKIPMAFLQQFKNKYNLQIIYIISIDKMYIYLFFRKNKKHKPEKTGPSIGLEAMSDLNMIVD